MGHADVDAADPGHEAPLVAVPDLGPPQGQDPDTVRAAHLLRGHHRKTGQEATGRTVRRDTLEAEPERDPPGSRTHSASPPRSRPTTPAGRVRDLREHGRHPDPPDPPTRRPHHTGQDQARMDGHDGEETPQDADPVRRVPPLHPRHGLVTITTDTITGEPGAGENSHARFGGRPRGKGPAQRAGTSPRGRPNIPMFATLLDRIDITGAILTADAMHAQRAHAEYLVEQRQAHYRPTAKRNQPHLYTRLPAAPSSPG